MKSEKNTTAIVFKIWATCSAALANRLHDTSRWVGTMPGASASPESTWHQPHPQDFVGTSPHVHLSEFFCLLTIQILCTHLFLLSSFLSSLPSVFFLISHITSQMLYIVCQANSFCVTQAVNFCFEQLVRRSEPALSCFASLRQRELKLFLVVNAPLSLLTTFFGTACKTSWFLLSPPPTREM